MCKVTEGFGTRSVLRVAFAGMTAALLAGCADSSRYIGDPLGNPFRSASSEPPPASYDHAAPPPYRPMRTAAVQSQPLSPPPGMPSHNVASYETAAHASPRLASNYVPPRTDRTASIPAPSGHGSWSAQGGMAVVAANGETAGVLAQRYNVPLAALLHENGLASAEQIHPGLRVVIPVYNANGSGAHVAADVPAHVSHDHSSRARLLAKHEMKDASSREVKVARQMPEVKDPHPPKAKVSRQAADRADANARDAKLAADHEKLRWAKGAQPVADAHGRAKAMAKLDGRKQKLASAGDLRGMPAPAADKAQVARVAPAVVREAPAKMAEAEEPAKRAAIDPTPTASLPPAAEKVASGSGNPEFRWPAHGRIIQGFKSGGNDGINIAVPEGTAVKAAESGTVAYAGSEIKGFGNLVLIRHPNGYVTAYANNGDIAVKRGEQVARGQTIAKSGQSGNVASPQLHFEVRKGSTPVDPTRYLAGL